jgi:hypothetical protein
MSPSQDLQAQQDELRNSIVIGWISALMLITIMFVVSLVKGAITNDFSRFAKDPGSFGLNVMIVIFAIHAVIPIALRVFNSTAFRWTMVGIAIFFLLMFLAHELTHMFIEKLPISIYRTLDWTHHGVMLWIVVMNIKWARAAGQAAARSGSGRPIAADLAVSTK